MHPMISFHLDDEERMVQETVRDFALAEVRPLYRTCERERAVAPELWRKYRDLGLCGAWIHAELGGAGLGAAATVALAEELAWGDPGIAAALLASYPAAQVVRALGTEPERRRLLAPVAERGARLALAISEADAPALGLATVAAPRGEGWALSGRKSSVAFGGEADVHVVAAQVNPAGGFEGIGVFVVAPGAPGLTRGAVHETLGLRAVPFADVLFDGCPAERLGSEGALAALSRALLEASILPAALAVGCARASYEHALRYAEERHAFGKPIGHFQSIAFLLSDLAMAVESARWMVWRAAAALDRGQPSLLPCTQAVSHAHEAAARVTEEGVQILGGHGYMQDHPVEKWMRDAKTLALYLASPEWAGAVAQAALCGEGAPPPGDALPVSGVQPLLS
jgi:acyl-CoA dehydrogenase